jgi:predicted acyltransferase
MENSKRFVALDVFRGLTVALMIVVNNPGNWAFVYPPLLHSKWNGCTPTDLVFPFFIFIVGYPDLDLYSTYNARESKVPTLLFIPHLRMVTD